MQTNCPAVLVVTTVLHAGRWCLTFGGHGHHGGPAAQRCSCSLGSTAPQPPHGLLRLQPEEHHEADERLSLE